MHLGTRAIRDCPVFFMKALSLGPQTASIVTVNLPLLPQQWPEFLGCPSWFAEMGPQVNKLGGLSPVFTLTLEGWKLPTSNHRS